MKKGLFITFEGGEACGKSSQVKLLKEYIEKREDKDEFLFVREPGGTPLAEEIRSLILHYEIEKPLPITELLLFTASRAQNCYKNIIPALESGKIVIADRFYDSTLAYQGEARKVANKEDILMLTRMAIGNLKPDLTFYFKLTPEIAFERKKNNASLAKLDNIERESMEFHKAVAKGYDYISSLEPERFCVIDATLSIEEISKIIIKKIEEKIKIRD